MNKNDELVSYNDIQKPMTAEDILLWLGKMCGFEKTDNVVKTMHEVAMIYINHKDCEHGSS